MRQLLRAGGTLDEEHLYVEREADRELRSALAQSDYCFVLAPRQIGKSSLRVRCQSHLRQGGIRCAVVDLTTIGTQIEEPGQWYLSFLKESCDWLGLPSPLSAWRAETASSPAQRWLDVLITYVLASSTEPIVIFVEEIDTILAIPVVRDDFFAAVRALYNRRADAPELRRLSFCLIGVAAPYDLIQDSTRTPFNIGRAIRLEDFTRAEVECFAPVLQGLGLSPATWIEHIYAWTSGHPFMTQRLLVDIQEMHQAGRLQGLRSIRKLLAERVAELFLRRGRSEESNLRYADQRFEKSRNKASLSAVYERVLSDSADARVPFDATDSAQIELQLCGLCSCQELADGQRILTVRNRVFRTLFDRVWLKEKQERWALRQRFERAIDRSTDNSDDEEVNALRVWSRQHEQVFLTEFVSYLRGQLAPHARMLRVSISGTHAEQPRDELSDELTLGHHILHIGWESRPIPAEVERRLRRAMDVARHALRGEEAREEGLPWAFTAVSPGRRRVLDLARRVASSELGLLLWGPPGVGKKLLAQDIHAHSGRSAGPMVVVSCASIPFSVLDAELFGVTAGAFTGSIARTGLFESAHGGTLVLDDLSSIPLETQVKLVRFVQTHKVRRVGGTQERTLLVRIIGISRQDLRPLVEEGKWRPDLLEVLGGVPIGIPSLEPDDVRRIAQLQLGQTKLRLGDPGGAHLIAELAELAAADSWPGNVRELSQTLELLANLYEPSQNPRENWWAMRAMRAGSRAAQAHEQSLRHLLNQQGLREVTSTLENIILLTGLKDLLALRIAPGPSMNRDLGKSLGISAATVAARMRRLGMSSDEDEISLARVERALSEECRPLVPLRQWLFELLEGS